MPHAPLPNDVESLKEFVIARRSKRHTSLCSRATLIARDAIQRLTTDYREEVQGKYQSRLSKRAQREHPEGNNGPS